jgi:hypothetical protein
VRINLVDQDRDRRRRRQRRKSRTFETVIAVPRTRDRQQPQRRSTSPRQRRARSSSRTDPAGAASPRAARRRIPWRAVVARFPVLLILAGLIALVVYVSAAEAFFVYEAEIVGARYTDPGAIYEAAGVYEQHIFWIDPGAVAEQVRGIQGIKAVTVSCSLPARVTIEVEEREPTVMWRALSQEWDWWLDQEGVVLPYHGSVDSPNTVFVVDSSARHLQEGDHIEPDGIVQSVLQLASALPDTRIFFYQSERGLSFAHSGDEGDWPVFVGDSEDLPRKIQAVQMVTDYLVEHNIQARYIDVRWADYPIYGKPLGESETEGE